MNAYSAALTYRSKKTNRGNTAKNWQTIGLGLCALALGGFIRPIIPSARIELSYLIPKVVDAFTLSPQEERPLPKSAPVLFNPLLDENGLPIEPISTEFSLIIPKIGVNAIVVPGVDPTNASDYHEALTEGVAHASTSFFPDENGAVYLFSHSTNYEWFVKDLNAVFYLLKNLEAGDLVVLIYKGIRYTYKISEKRVVSPSEVSYMAPIEGKRMLILQTCWPPGSTTERLLVFAGLTDTQKLEK